MAVLLFRRLFLTCCGSALAIVALSSPGAASVVGLRDAGSRSIVVWSTSEMVESTPNHLVQRFTLWLGATDGSHPQILGEGHGPRLSPDGRWIAFNRDLNLYVMAIDGGRPWLVARNTVSARWSPSSQYLAVTPGANRALYVVDMATRRRMTIDRGAKIYGMSFSPSGKAIVWARMRGQGYEVEGRVDLFSARVDGTRRSRLTRTGNSSTPLWGPRGIAFTRVRPSGNVHFPIHELWMMRPDGVGLRRLTRASHFPLEWSADGRTLLTSTYTSSSAVGSVVDVETARITTVMRGRYGFALALSRDGRSVLAWVPSSMPNGNLVRLGPGKTRTILWKDADPIADWNA